MKQSSEKNFGKSWREGEWELDYCKVKFVFNNHI